MAIPKVFESEYRMCLILWENEPIRSAKLAELCKEQLGWSRTTTYTVIRRLSDRGVVQNNKTIVTSLIPKEEIQLREMDELMNKTFENDLPAFVAAIARRQNLSDDEAAQLNSLLRRGDE